MDNKNIKKAIKILKFGGVIVYPTDTAYALGGIFDDKKVIKKILKLKKRKDEKFTLVASSISQVRKFFKLNKKELELARKYWPGSLSIVVSDKYAIRVPDNEVARKLARGAGKPIIATSANISKQATPYEAKNAVKADLILDAGTLKNKKTSTIVKVENGEIKIIRKGAVKL